MLELKIPPPIVTLACAALAWTVGYFTPNFAYLFQARIPTVVILVLLGISLPLSGLIAFRKAKTTINPHTPERSTHVVQSGPYRFTRNPMYLGMALLLLGFCVYLKNPLTVVSVIAFISYITRFQIRPEERFLLKNFGEPYAQYMRSVRRWL